MEENDPRFNPDWSPATAEPGEAYTYEGQIAAVGAFTRGLHNRDPQHRRYQREMAKPGFWILGIGIAVVAVIIVASAIFS